MVFILKTFYQILRMDHKAEGILSQAAVTNFIDIYTRKAILLEEIM